eukprot:GHVO01057168.1.p1 GENE.GHVO01057168.1~~GHVO01057168.1.p1  ORF type:complete len:491 (-),score=62.76 GHVO01057168.1:1035-2507(-)
MVNTLIYSDFHFRLLFSDAAGPQPEPEPEFHMDVPEMTSYKDLHSGMQDSFPQVSKGRVEDFFGSCSKPWDAKFEDLYKETYCRYFRQAVTTEAFIKASVWAEMRKSASYIVDVRIACNGVIEETQCECAVGQGPTAHCKHVGAVLFGLTCFKQSGNVVAEKTCTQVLQTFHKAKPHRGSPVKAATFGQFRGDRTPVLFDPRPSHRRALPGRLDDLHSRLINRRDNVQRPIMDLLRPANVEAFARDHDYMALSMEDHFLQKSFITYMTAEKAHEIEETTRGQADAQTWKEERKKRLTSSIFGEICKATDRKNKDLLAKRIIIPASINAPSLKHGRRYESVALEEFQNDSGVTVMKCGLFVAEGFPVLAASPDGIIDRDTVVEVKCPLSAFKKAITPVTVPYLYFDNDDQLTLKKNHDYYYQIQGQLFCAKRKVCKFVVYTGTSLEIIDVHRDEDFISEMLIKLRIFYNDYFKDALIHYLFYKQTGQYRFD